MPFQLLGTEVKITDFAGVERPAPLFFVSPEQANCLAPEDTATGAAMITIRSGDGVVVTGSINIIPIAPGIFTANANGYGVPAGLTLRVRADGSRNFEPIFQVDSQGRLIPSPIDLGPEGEQVYLILFGTGMRKFNLPPDFTVKIGGMDAQVTYAGPQGESSGLDQINVLLPRNLLGRGEADVVVRIENNASNTATIRIN